MSNTHDIKSGDFVDIEKVNKVDENKKPKRSVSYKTLLVPKSVWEAKEDCLIDVHVGTVKEVVFYGTKQIIYEFADKDLVDGKSYKETPIKKGEQFTLIRKIKGKVKEEKDHKYINPDHYYSYEHFALVELEDSSGNNVIFFEKDIGKHFQCVDRPAIYEYAVYNKARQSYYADTKRWNWRELLIDPKGGPLVINDVVQYKVHPYDKDDVIIFDDNKFKKWKDAGKAKLWMLQLSGYMQDMEGSPSFEYMGYDGPPANITSDFVIHKIDKVTKEIVEEIEFYEWLHRTMRLKPLVMKYGSAVKSVYSKLDKQGVVNDFSGIFFVDKGKDDDDEFNALTKEEKDQINDSLKRIDNDAYVKTLSKSQIAVALKDRSHAVMLRMTYSGDGVVKFIDLTESKELVGEEIAE